MKSRKESSLSPLTTLFLMVETVLYALILVSSGKTLVASSFCAIVLCFLHALTGIRGRQKYIIAGLFFTVLADFCLVVCNPIQQLWGMVFFLIVQSLYGLQLHRQQPSHKLQLMRGILLTVGIGVCVLVLRSKTDLLALISICYYVNLLVNAAHAFCGWKTNKLLPIALVFFILCDTVIGLQVMLTTYLPVGSEILLYRLLFIGLNLSWLFYLPSQVLLSLYAAKR